MSNCADLAVPGLPSVRHDVKLRDAMFVFFSVRAFANCAIVCRNFVSLLLFSLTFLLPFITLAAHFQHVIVVFDSGHLISPQPAQWRINCTAAARRQTDRHKKRKS
jgi:hypothetical protein